MYNIIVASLAVAFILALLEPLSDVISLFIDIKVINALFSITLSTVSLLILEPFETKAVIKILAIAFLSRTLLTIAERIATYRWTSVKQV